MSRSRFLLLGILIMLILAAGCQNGVGEGLSNINPDEGDLTLPPQATPTPISIPPEITELVINGEEIEPTDDVYQVPGEVNPGDSLVIVVTIATDRMGSVHVLGAEASYFPTPDHSVTVRVTPEITNEMITNSFVLQLSSGNDLVEYMLAFNPGSAWPPVMVVDAPSEGFVGQTITLDASASFDFQGETISFDWSQVHNPDRYAGSEYLSGRQLDIERAADSAVEVTPTMPGLYRFEVSGSCGSRTSSKWVDVLVRWPEGSPFSIRSVALAVTTPDDSLDYVPEILERIADMGANYVDIHVSIHQDNYDSVEIIFCNPTWSPEGPCTTYSDERLTRMIDMAHDHGLGVILSPGLVIARHQVSAWQMAPPDWGPWFESYQEKILHYAEIANAAGVEIFSVGNELVNTHPSWIQWDILIDEVRKIYTGELIYRDNQPVYFPDNDPFPAWDEMDYIGINFWYQATGALRGYQTEDTNPSVETMLDSFNQQVLNPLDSLVAEFQKPVILTELGPRGWDGVNIEPPFTNCDAAADTQENVNYTDAALQLAVERGWIGVNAWFMQPKRTPWKPEGCDLVRDIRDTSLEDLFTLWYGGWE